MAVAFRRALDDIAETVAVRRQDGRRPHGVQQEGAMKHYVLAVTSSAQEGRDADYNEWYDAYHMNDMLAVPGITSGRRLQATPGSPNPPPARYLAEFDIEADDAHAVVADMLQRFQSGEMSMTTALDQSSVQIWLYERR
jgi:hypothetical protein